MGQTFASSTKNESTNRNTESRKRHQTSATKGSVTPFHNYSAQEIRNQVQFEKQNEEDRYNLSQLSSGFSEREVIAYLVKKHTAKETRQAGVDPTTLGQAWQPWIQWGEPSKPISDYQRIYDTCDQFTDKEIKRVRKHPLWKNMNIINQAMAKTSTSFVSAKGGNWTSPKDKRLKGGASPYTTT